MQPQRLLEVIGQNPIESLVLWCSCPAPSLMKQNWLTINHLYAIWGQYDFSQKFQMIPDFKRLANHMSFSSLTATISARWDFNKAIQAWLRQKNVHAPKYILPFEIYQNSWKILPLHLVLSIFEIKSSFVIHLSIVLSRLQPLYTVAEEKFRVNELDFSQKACKQACSSTLKGSFGDIASHSG